MDSLIKNGKSNDSEVHADFLDDEGLRCCAICGKRKEKKIFFSILKVEKLIPVNCDCVEERWKELEREKEVKEYRRKQAEARIKPRYQEARFSNYQITEENLDNFVKMKEYVGNFPELKKEGKGILFYGETGTGKTHAAITIANEILFSDKLDQVSRYSVLLTSVAELVDLPRTDEEKRQLGILLERIRSCSLVVFDDLGAERTSSYAQEQVYKVIEERYSRKLPMIVTTNRSLEELTEKVGGELDRIHDRLLSVCAPTQFACVSWRRDEAAITYDQYHGL